MDMNKKIRVSQLFSTKINKDEFENMSKIERSIILNKMADEYFINANELMIALSDK